MFFFNKDLLISRLLIVSLLLFVGDRINKWEVYF